MHLETVRAAALLAYLALEGTPQPRQKLIGLLWGHLSENKARANLRHTLWHLRTRLATPDSSPLIETSPQTVTFIRQDTCQVDVDAFENFLRRETQIGVQAGSPHNRFALLDQALDLYEGDLLDGLYIDDSPGFNEWLIVERERLRSQAVQALQRLVDFHLGWGDYKSGIRYANRLLKMEAWQEETHRQLMRLLMFSGQRSAALAQYEICRRVLAEELGVEPSPETQTLVQSIRQGGVTAGPAAASPIHIPPQTTPFVGREKELARLIQLLNDPACRLITLVGPGGMGKTRLAVRACAEASNAQGHAPGQESQAQIFADGIFFVALVGISSPELLIPAISDAIGLSFHSSASITSQLMGFLEDKNLLLVLDNFEHLLAGTGLIVQILQTAPGVKILVTSRQRLNLGEEWLFEVKGLTIPPTGDGASFKMNDFSAVSLFAQSVRRIRLDFTLSEENQTAVAQICNLVEGMPLALELAAAWARTLSCQEIASEIASDLDLLASSRRDLPERHRSMRSMFEHSWQRLSEEERDAFKRLSVFRGGFQRQAAQEVSGTSLALLSALVDKSLLRCTPGGRYELHELLRQYAAEKLTPAERVCEGDRHCHYFTAFLKARADDFQARRLKQALAEVSAEIENVRTSWNWAIQTRQLKPILQAQYSLYRFYELRNWFSEGEVAFSQAAKMLAAEPSAESSASRAKILNWQARFCHRMARYDKARELLYESLSLFEQIQPANKGNAGNILRELGIIALMIGDYSEAKVIFQVSLEIWRELGNSNLISSLINLGYVDCQLGEYGEARRLLEEANALCQQGGYQESGAFAFYYLGLVSLGEANLAQAARYIEKALTSYRDLDHRWGMALSLQGLALVALETGDFDAALRYSEEGLENARQVNDDHSTALCLNCLGRAVFGLGNFEEAAGWHHQAIQTGWQAHQPPIVLDGLIGLAEVRARAGELEAACELLWLVRSHPATIERERQRAERLLSAWETRLSSQAFDAARQRGEVARLEEWVNI